MKTTRRWGNAPKANLDTEMELGEMTSLRLQMATDRMSKFMTVLSNLIKKVVETEDSQVQNQK